MFLESKLLRAGTKFEVTDKYRTNLFPPGSVGFISLTNGLDDSFQNVARVSTILIRRGKSGKARLDLVTLRMPILLFASKNFEKLMPTGEAERGLVHAEPVGPSKAAIRHMSNLDFLGWASAIAHRLYYLNKQCRHSRWPTSKHDPLVVINRLRSFFDEDPERNLTLYGEGSFREDFVFRARKMHSSVIRIDMLQELVCRDVERNAADFLRYVNRGEFLLPGANDETNEYRFTENDKLLADTCKHYKSQLEEIQTLINRKSKKQ